MHFLFKDNLIIITLVVNMVNISGQESHIGFT